MILEMAWHEVDFDQEKEPESGWKHPCFMIGKRSSKNWLMNYFTVSRVIRAIRGLHEHSKGDKARKELENVLDYFRNHRHRMNYAELRRQGIPIGSGIVEAVNKTHVGERLKKSGMEGGQAVLTFRSLVKSNRFDRAWEMIMGAIDEREPDNDNRESHGRAKAA